VLGGTAAIAGGMMTKGPIALFVPLFAFGADWILRRKWKLIFSPWHILDLLLIALFLMPMSIGLYQQFDLHPEKWIDGRQGTSGLKFFFWTQSFGRITGENAWSNGADPLFLLNSMSWAFLPWILLFLVALVLNVAGLLRQKFRLREGQEWLSTGGFILTYLSLSLSRYQLPHYILVAFPLAAIMVGKLLHDFITGERLRKLCRVFAGIQIGISALLLLGALLIIGFVFPADLWVFALWLLGAAIWVVVLLRDRGRWRAVWISVAGIVIANVFVTHFFYYPLLKYQVGSSVGRFIRAHDIPQHKLWAWRMDDPLDAVHFYARRVVRRKDEFPPPGGSGDYLLMMRKDLPALDTTQRACQIVQQGRLFKVSELTPEFLSPQTRDSATKPWVLVRLR
jgi:4-amino-4-deoxy-L-arabinose transferase-like glycosyltransferase